MSHLVANDGVGSGTAVSGAKITLLPCLLQPQEVPHLPREAAQMYQVTLKNEESVDQGCSYAAMAAGICICSP